VLECVYVCISCRCGYVYVKYIHLYTCINMYTYIYSFVSIHLLIRISVHIGGRKASQDSKKVKGSTTKELRRIQKDMLMPTLASFPGGQALDDVILVGGSTRIPAVQRLVKIITGIDPRRTVNPDEAVSLGAAVMAGILDGDITDMQVMSAWQAAMYRAFYADYRKTGKRIE
jgi:hypothetical protein